MASDEEVGGPSTTTTEIVATFDPPWKWEDLGLRLHDSPTGVVLDHIAVRSRAAQVDGLRIGIQCVRVNRFPTDGKSMREIERIIKSREEEQERLMLKFVNTSKAGLNGFTGSKIMDHGFVINPVAKKAAPETFDVEEGGGGTRQKKGIREKAASKAKTTEQRKLEELERSEAVSRDGGNVFDSDGGRQMEWSPVCAPWESFIYWAHEQARLDLVQLLCYVATRNPAVLACAVSLLGAGTVAADNKGDRAGWSSFCKIDLPYKLLLQNHIICTLVAIPLGIALQVLELLSLPESQPWWCVSTARAEMESGILVLEGNDGTDLDMSHSGDQDEVDLSVCDYNQECPYCSGKWPLPYIIVAWLIMLLELYFRGNALMKALKGRRRIVSWDDRKQDVLHRAAVILQSKARGRQTRQRIAAVSVPTCDSVFCQTL